MLSFKMKVLYHAFNAFSPLLSLSRRARDRKKTWLKTSCPTPRCGEGLRVRRETRQAKKMGTKTVGKCMRGREALSTGPPSLLTFSVVPLNVTRRRADAAEARFEPLHSRNSTRARPSSELRRSGRGAYR